MQYESHPRTTTKLFEVNKNKIMKRLMFKNVKTLLNNTKQSN